MILRGPKPETGYYQLDNKIADDRSLSWAARGLLIHLLAKPGHWRVSVAALVNQTKETRAKSGRDAVYALLKELEKVGYVKRQQTRLPNGRLGEVDYIVSEQKASPLTAQPHTAGPTQVMTKKAVKTDSKSKDLALPERAHRGTRDKPPATKANAACAKAHGKTVSHPIWNHELSRLTAEGVSEGRARACLAKLLHALGDHEALELLETARDAGESGTALIDEIMRRVYAETR